MGLLPKIQAFDAGQQIVDTFYGLNRDEKIREGEWSDELNLSSDRYPMLGTRARRSLVRSYYNSYIVDMIGKENLVVLAVSDYDENERTANLFYGDNRVYWKVYNYTNENPTGLVSFGAYIIILGLNVWYNTADGTNGTITDMPDMDYVIECNNRLWGCKYGVVDGEVVNEIYASKLGDFKTWDDYDGTSMASYAASVGTDGPWTGAIAYQGKPHFFKEKHVHKVYISATGAHQIVETPIIGVQEQCSNSLCVLDGVLYYMSRDGVCAYDGSTPTVISKALHLKSIALASFGGSNGKLYCDIHDTISNSSAGKTLYTYDVRRGIWHIEDRWSKHAGQKQGLYKFVKLGDSLFTTMAGLGIFDSVGQYSHLYDFEGVAGNLDPVDDADSVAYTCTSGLIGWQTIEQKYVSRFDMRLTLPAGATMTVYIEYDSSGTWEEQGTVSGGTNGGTGSIMIPVRPRRCDHFRIRLSGTGEMRMYSWAKRLLKGSDVVK